MPEQAELKGVLRGFREQAVDGFGVGGEIVLELRPVATCCRQRLADRGLVVLPGAHQHLVDPRVETLPAGGQAPCARQMTESGT